MARFTDSLDQDRSRLVQGGMTEYHPKRLGWWSRFVMNRHPSDVNVIISKRAEARPDIIAYQIYGDAKLAWLVMQYNDIVDPEEEMLRGKQLVLPLPSRVNFTMMSRPRGGITRRI